MQEVVWISSFCTEKGTTEDIQALKLSRRYLDNIAGTVMEKLLDFIECAKTLHKNFQLFLETPNGSGDLPFLELSTYENDDRSISCYWYQKMTNTSLNSVARRPYNIIKM